MMGLKRVFFVSVLLTLGLTVKSTNASVIYTGSNVSVGLLIDQEAGSEVGPISAASGHVLLENTSHLMSNDLRWNFDGKSAKIVSTMSGGPDKDNFAYSFSTWLFQVDNPVDYMLFASVNQINSGLYDFTDQRHLLSGDGSGIPAGTYTGTLLAGHEYAFEFDNIVSGNSNLIFQIPEPAMFVLLLLALVGIIKRDLWKL